MSTVEPASLIIEWLQKEKSAWRRWSRSSLSLASLASTTLISPVSASNTCQSARSTAMARRLCGGKDKERFTGMFLADSDGNQYPPFFVLRTVPSKNSDTAQDNTAARHGFGARFWKEINGLSSATDVQIFGNRYGWWNSELTVEFLDYHFADRSTDEPVLLLLADFFAHWTDAAAEHTQDLSVFLLRVPPGLTSVCQPADVAWFAPMKRRLREEWVQFLMRQLRPTVRVRQKIRFDSSRRRVQMQSCERARRGASWGSVL